MIYLSDVRPVLFPRPLPLRTAAATTVSDTTYDVTRYSYQLPVTPTVTAIVTTTSTVTATISVTASVTATITPAAAATGAHGVSGCDVSKRKKNHPRIFV